MIKEEVDWREQWEEPATDGYIQSPRHRVPPFHLQTWNSLAGSVARGGPIQSSEIRVNSG